MSARVHQLMLDTESDHELGVDERQQVNKLLDAILATEKFEAAPQMSAFLRYVVEQAAAGNQSRIKAFTVAVDALGKPVSFDPQNDPVVRVLAGRLRAALSTYNQENRNSPLMITMTKGSYVPQFNWQVSVPDYPVPGEATNPVDAAESSARSECVEPTPAESLDPTLRDAISHSVPPPLHKVEKQSSGNASAAAAASHTDAVHPAGFTRSARKESASDPVVSGVRHAVGAIPKPVYIAMFLAVVAMAAIMIKSTEPGTQALAPSAPIAVRSRPDSPSVFISAVDQEDTLENGLKTLVSSVISENPDLSVYRILDQNQPVKYWPEDYVLTLAALNLPDETHVDLQLIEAQTGRIIHSQTVSLKEQAAEQLSQRELTRLIDATRSIVAEQGPLLTHYAKQSAKE